MHPVNVVAAFWKEDVNPWEGEYKSPVVGFYNLTSLD